MEEFFFEGAEGKQIAATAFEVKNPVAVIQIAHGMAEHRKRYYEFAEFLNKAGISVFLNDHRGHGETAGTEDQAGIFAPENGWSIVMQDLHLYSELIRQRNPKIPFFIMGHSMGSFLVRGLLTFSNTDFSGAIICGSAGEDGLTIIGGKLVAKREIKKLGWDQKSPFMDKMMFGSFNKKIKKPRTTFDWLSTDEIQVDKYINDPWCGFICSSSFYSDLLDGLKLAMSLKDMKKINKDLPLFFIAGEKDPVGKSGRGVRKSVAKYKKAGIKEIDLKLYENGRHEILNEIFKKEVYNDVQQWILTHL